MLLINLKGDNMNFKNNLFITMALLFVSNTVIANTPHPNNKSTSNATTLGSIESAIITKVTQAYGGDTLKSAKSIVITDHNKRISTGQGESPNQPGFFRIDEVLTIDFKSKRKSLLSWRVSRTSKDLEKFIFDGQQGYIYDILNKKYAKEDWLTYTSTGGGIVLRSDTMIAHSLGDNIEVAHYEGEASYRGVLHYKLKVKINAGFKYTLFINKKSGYISKMVRQHPRAGEISYAFSNHTKSNDIVFAKDLNFTVGGQVKLVSVKRDIKINPLLKEAFSKPANYTAWGTLLDTSTLQVRKISENTYHVGSDRSFTLFVDAGDYFIASGGHQGLKDKLQAVNALQALDKPLKYMISTHHHSEHLPSLKEAANLGAKIVTVSEHLLAIQDGLSSDFNAEGIELVDGKLSLGNGAVDIYDIATMHADNYLLVYVPESKLVFAEDHFETQLKTAVPRVHKDMVIFREAMEALAIDVEKLVDGHSPRQLSITEFKEATDNYRNIRCPQGYSICENG